MKGSYHHVAYSGSDLECGEQKLPEKTGFANFPKQKNDYLLLMLKFGRSSYCDIINEHMF